MWSTLADSPRCQTMLSRRPSKAESGAIHACMQRKDVRGFSGRQQPRITPRNGAPARRRGAGAKIEVLRSSYIELLMQMETTALRIAEIVALLELLHSVPSTWITPLPAPRIKGGMP